MIWILLALACSPPGPKKKRKAPDTGTAAPAPITTVLVVRHFEKDVDGTNDPPLNDDGLARADALRDLLVDLPLTAIFATEFQRTQQTAQPTATQHGLEIDIRWEADEELAEVILDDHVGGILLSAGHSNTVADLLDGLGVRPRDLPVIDDGDYGDLWTVTVDADAGTSLAHATVSP